MYDICWSTYLSLSLYMYVHGLTMLRQDVHGPSYCVTVHAAVRYIAILISCELYYNIYVYIYIYYVLSSLGIISLVIFTTLHVISTCHFNMSFQHVISTCQGPLYMTINIYCSLLFKAFLPIFLYIFFAFSRCRRFLIILFKII